MSKWDGYWQKRAVKAEMTLMNVSVIAERDGDKHGIAKLVNDYFAVVAAGGIVNEPPASPAAGDADK